MNKILLAAVVMAGACAMIPASAEARRGVHGGRVAGVHGGYRGGYHGHRRVVAGGYHGRYGRYGYRYRPYRYGAAAVGVGAAAAYGASRYGGCGPYYYYDSYAGVCRPRY